MELVEEVALEGDGRERRPRAVERVQLQLVGVGLEYKFGADAGEAGDAPYERPQRAAAHRQLHGRVASVSSAFGVWEEE